MKRKGLLKLLCATMLLAIAIVYLPSCSNDEEDAEYWTVTLEDHYAPYAPNDKWGDWSLGPKSVFGSRDNGESLLFSDNEIKGFSYEEGYVYVLRIKATPTLQQVGTCNPPPYTFELVEVISKKQPKIDPAIWKNI